MRTKIQTSVIKKTLLLALMLVTSFAWAEWVIVSSTDQVNYYVDPATIRKNSNLRKVWTIQDLKQRHKDGEISRRSRNEYDCDGERYRVLALTTHSEPMANGTTLTTNDFEIPDRWTQIAPETISERVLKIVCAK